MLTPNEHREAVETYGAANFKVGMGAESIKELLMEVDLEKEAEQLRKTLEKATGQKRIRAIKRLEIVESFRRSGNKPEWMVLDVLPVIPPELRPMVPLDGADTRQATSTTFTAAL